MPCASSRSSASASAQLLAGELEQPLCLARLGADLRLGEPQAHRQRDEALLGAVVEIPLDPAAAPRRPPRRSGSREAASSSRACALATASAASSANAWSRCSVSSGQRRRRSRIRCDQGAPDGAADGDRDADARPIAEGAKSVAAGRSRSSSIDADRAAGPSEDADRRALGRARAASRRGTSRVGSPNLPTIVDVPASTNRRITAERRSRSLQTSSVTVWNTSSGGASPATSVATRRSAACSAASRRTFACARRCSVKSRTIVTTSLSPLATIRDSFQWRTPPDLQLVLDRAPAVRQRPLDAPEDRRVSSGGRTSRTLRPINCSGGSTSPDASSAWTSR